VFRLAAHKLPYAHKLPPSKPFDHFDPVSECSEIVAAIEDFKPTTLIRVSGNALRPGVGTLFSREVVEAMSRINALPIIFALSNPTEQMSACPSKLTAGPAVKAIYASGVPFPQVHVYWQRFLPSQANNLYIFPAVGMAIYTNTKRATDEMFIGTAHALADQVTPEQLKLGMLFPPQSNILEVELQTAARVAKLVFDSGLARVERPTNIEKFIQRHVYKPEYKALA
jgi:malate dehydrogenase (oxaloacetate-decarboxylating)(NADP+)